MTERRRMGEFEFAAAQEDAFDKQLQWEETQISQAGVMRCCIQSLGDYFDSLGEGNEVPVGTRVPCKYAPSERSHGFTLTDRGTGLWIATWIADKDD